MTAVAPLPLLFMVLASTALLFALVALWSSLRRALAATGDGAPSLEAAELPDRAALLDEKKSLLRAIKDLEYEHAVGKISPEDFKRLDLAYRVRAKEVIALLEQDLAPFQAKAEALLAERVRAEAPTKNAPTTKASAKADEPRAEEDDDAALRERARRLREEADRLERRAGKAAAKAPDADTKAPDADTKAPDANATGGDPGRDEPADQEVSS